MLPDCSFLSVCFSDKEADTAHRATEAESVRLCQRDDWALIAKTAASRLCVCLRATLYGCGCGCGWLDLRMFNVHVRVSVCVCTS